jgi:hypothetical protein
MRNAVVEWYATLEKYRVAKAKQRPKNAKKLKKPPSAAEHACRWCIPRDTFYHYIHSDPKKRRKVGGAPGAKSKVSDENTASSSSSTPSVLTVPTTVSPKPK